MAAFSDVGEASDSLHKEKRSRTDSSKHLIGYRRAWERQFPWLVAVENDGSVTGMMCSLLRIDVSLSNSA